MEMKTDTGLFFEKYNINKLIGYDNTFVNMADTNEENICTMKLRLSNRRDVYIRTYKKIIDALSEIGGFLKGIILVGDILCYFVKITLYKNYILQFFNLDETKFSKKKSFIKKVKGKKSSKKVEFHREIMKKPSFYNVKLSNIYNNNMNNNISKDEKVNLNSKLESTINNINKNNNRFNSTIKTSNKLFVGYFPKHKEEEKEKEIKSKFKNTTNIDNSNNNSTLIGLKLKKSTTSKHNLNVLNQNFFDTKEMLKKVINNNNDDKNEKSKDKSKDLIENIEKILAKKEESNFKDNSHNNIESISYKDNNVSDLNNSNVNNESVLSNNAKNLQMILKNGQTIHKNLCFSKIFCKYKGFKRMLQINKEYSKIKFIFDIVQYIKLKNEVNIIEKFVLNDEQRRELGIFYQFDYDFSFDKEGYDYLFKENKKTEVVGNMIKRSKTIKKL